MKKNTNNNKIKIIIAAVVVVVIASIFGVTKYMQASNTVATIAGERVSKSEFTFFLKQTKQQKESQANIDPADANAIATFWATPQDGKSAEEAVKEQTLDTIKEIKIQVKNAKDSKIVISRQEKDTALKNLDDQIKQSFGADKDTNKKFSDQLGITIAEYKTMYADFLLVSKYAEEAQKKFEPNNDEIKAYYDKNKDLVDKVTVGHVLFMTIDQTTNAPLADDKIKEAEKKANDVLAQAKAGSDFAELAKKYSEDPGSKDKGGEYTIAKDGQMVPEFEDWAFKTKQGEFGIVKSSFGYHVMKNIKRTTFDDNKATIITRIQSEKLKSTLDEQKKDPKFNTEINKRVYDLIKL